VEKQQPDLVAFARTQTNDGNERRMGIEIEFACLTLDDVADITANLLNGTVESKGRYERQIEGDDAGEWVIELDFQLLKKMGRKDYPEKSFESELMASAEQGLAWLSESLVPVEVVTPPLPLSRASEVEQLISKLRNAGAKGTGDSIAYAFGMQLNPELPDLSSETITAYLKAFLCLYEWLFEQADLDFSRRMTNYIDPFPKRYVKKVTSPDYWPDQDQLIADYLKDNPTRNRALDLLPLFRHLDESSVENLPEISLIKARPTLHYRLPDCHIDQEDWGLHTVWNQWAQVEQLAADRERLNACCEDYQHYVNKAFAGWTKDWLRQVHAKWLT